MPAANLRRYVTSDEFLTHAAAAGASELVRGEVRVKVRDYRAAGTRLIWVIDPAARIVSVRRTSGPDTRLTEIDVLDGSDVLPGFTIPVTRLFARLAK